MEFSSEFKSDQSNNQSEGGQTIEQFSHMLGCVSILLSHRGERLGGDSIGFDPHPNPLPAREREF